MIDGNGGEWDGIVIGEMLISSEVLVGEACSGGGCNKQWGSSGWGHFT